jgi:amino acid transporter
VEGSGHHHSGSEHHEGMLPVVESGESVDVSKRSDVDKLHGGAVGLAGVLFLTVTGSAPITAMLLNTPLSVGYGNGLYTPAGFIFATIILTIFSVGYIAMARKVTAVGGFYSFISHGLGRELAMGTGLAITLAYSVFEASLCGGFAYFATGKLAQYGYNISWVWPALFMVALISILSYFDIHLSARILGVALVTEVLILLAFDASVFFSSDSNVNAAAINPFKAFHNLPASGAGATAVAAGTAGIGVFFAFWSWVGFEMAPNYGEESKNPKKIVPLAMYISVIGLGIFYTVTSWASISAYANESAAAFAAQNNYYGYYLTPAVTFGSQFMSDLMSYLILTGSFACGMAFHQTTARYMYSLGRERVLPAQLGRTHPKYRSPHIASVTQTVIAAAIVLAFGFGEGTGDPGTNAYIYLYGLMAVMGVVIILCVQALVSVAIINYFRTHHSAEQHWFTTMVAPLISVVGQIYVVYLAIKNIDFLATGVHWVRYLIVIDALVFLLGVAMAFYYKSNDRAKYETIGRLVNEGL